MSIQIINKREAVMYANGKRFTVYTDCDNITTFLDWYLSETKLTFKEYCVAILDEETVCTHLAAA